MSYTSLERSAQDSQAIELFEFNLSGEAAWRFTSAQKDTLADSRVWESRPGSIGRSAIVRTSNHEGEDITVTLPTSEPVVQLYRKIPPWQKLILSIWRIQRADGPGYTMKAKWKGVVRSVTFGHVASDLTAEGYTSVLAQEMPRFVYSSLCNNILFDEFCKLPKLAHSDLVTVQSVIDGGETLELNSLTAARPLDPAYYLGGSVELDDGDARMVLAQTGDQVRLLLPFPQLAIGQIVRAVAGCPHDIGACDTKFANSLRHSGYPDVPGLNPFSIALN